MTFPLLKDSLLKAGAALAAALPAAAQANTPASEAAVRNEAVVKGAFEAWEEGGNVFDILAPDVVWTIHGSGTVADTYHGVEDFTQRASLPLVSRLAGPLVPQVHDIWAAGDTVIIRFDASSTTTGGNPYSNQFVWIFGLEDGVVTEAEAFLDLVAYQEVVDNNEPRQD